MLAATVALACSYSAPASVPIVPSAFMADVVSNTSGTMPGVPTRSMSYTQLYDYGNKRLRKDGGGHTKVYRYDRRIAPPLPPVAGEPIAPTPMGFLFDTNSMENCCWLWLWDPKTQMANRMFEISVDKNSVDLGPSAKHGGAEHYQKKGSWPFTHIADSYFSNGTLVAQDTFASMVSGTTVGNTTYSNVVVGAIDVSNFAHPTVNPGLPHLGKCKQFGKDPMCQSGSAAHAQMLADHAEFSFLAQ